MFLLAALIYGALPTHDKHKPIRIYFVICKAEGSGRAELIELLGKGRAKKGMFEGNLEEGELEIGQIASSIDKIRPAAEILYDYWQDFLFQKDRISKLILK